MALVIHTMRCAFLCLPRDVSTFGAALLTWSLNLRRLCPRPDLSAHRKMACHFSLVCTLGKIGKPSSLCTRQVGKGRDTREFKSTFETTGAQPEAARLCCFSAVPCWVSWVDVGVSGRSPDVAKRQRMSRFPAFVKPDVGRHLVCRAKP